LFLHLFSCKKYENQYVVPDITTQEGIRHEIECNLGFLSRIIIRNEKEGFIYRKKSKVLYKKRKQNAFFLTPKGLDQAKKINEMKFNNIEKP